MADSGAPVVTTVTHVQIEADIPMASRQELAFEQGAGSIQATEASLNASNVIQNTSFKLTAEEAATLRRTYTIAEFKVLHSSSMGLCDVREFIDTSEQQEHVDRLHRVAFRRALLDVQGNTHGAVDDAGQHREGKGPGAGRGTKAKSKMLLWHQRSEGGSGGEDRRVGEERRVGESWGGDARVREGVGGSATKVPRIHGGVDGVSDSTHPGLRTFKAAERRKLSLQDTGSGAPAPAGAQFAMRDALKSRHDPRSWLHGAEWQEGNKDGTEAAAELEEQECDGVGDVETDAVEAEASRGVGDSMAQFGPMTVEAALRLVGEINLQSQSITYKWDESHTYSGRLGGRILTKSREKSKQLDEGSNVCVWYNVSWDDNSRNQIQLQPNACIVAPCERQQQALR